jgi:hypothetical protein
LVKIPVESWTKEKQDSWLSNVFFI